MQLEKDWHADQAKRAAWTSACALRLTRARPANICWHEIDKVAGGHTAAGSLPESSLRHPERGLVATIKEAQHCLAFGLAHADRRPQFQQLIAHALVRGPGGQPGPVRVAVFREIHPVAHHGGGHVPIGGRGRCIAAPAAAQPEIAKNKRHVVAVRCARRAGALLLTDIAEHIQPCRL